MALAGISPPGSALPPKPAEGPSSTKETCAAHRLGLEGPHQDEEAVAPGIPGLSSRSRSRRGARARRCLSALVPPRPCQARAHGSTSATGRSKQPKRIRPPALAPGHALVPRGCCAFPPVPTSPPSPFWREGFPMPLCTTGPSGASAGRFAGLLDPAPGAKMCQEERTLALSLLWHSLNLTLTPAHPAGSSTVPVLSAGARRQARGLSAGESLAKPSLLQRWRLRTHRAPQLPTLLHFLVLEL